MVRKRIASAHAHATDAAPVRHPKAAAPIDVVFDALADGTRSVSLHYRGPIAHCRPLFVRFGERRDGKDWMEPRDIAMAVERDEATAKTVCAPGVEGACFAFFTATEGDKPTEVWDNAGRPYGYYAYDLEHQRLDAR